MRFIIGPPPDDPDFAPEQDGWRKLRELGPGSLALIGGLLGVPLAAIVGYGWSRVPGVDLSVQFKMSAILPLLLLLFMVVFFAGLFFVHELVHVLACPRFGLTSATMIGVWPSKLMAYGHHAGPIACRRWMVVGTAPFLLLSVAPVLVAFAGGPHWAFLALVSVVNALGCGGDALICMLLLYQVPFDASVRSKGWDTWWRPAEPNAAPTVDT